MKKALIINGSPDYQNGESAKLSHYFSKGLKTGGYELFSANSYAMNISPCQADYSCWMKPGGQCIHQDDLNDLFPRLQQADTLILVTPVYIDGMSGSMKILLERLLPMLEPFFIQQDGHTRHPRKPSFSIKKVVLIASCGLYEMDNFDPLIMHVQAICRNLGTEYSGALLRPHTLGLDLSKNKKELKNEIYQAAENAGMIFARKGFIPEEEADIVSRPLLSSDEFLAQANKFFHRIMKRFQRSN